MQKQPFNCADARHLVHLSVGDDTLPEEEKQLTEHLHSCAECRAYHAGTVDVMHVLEQVRDDDSVDMPAGAVWSAISDRIRSRPQARRAPERRRFNGAVAALCACSLTLALVTVVRSLPTNDSDPGGVYAPAMSVSLEQPQQDAPELKQVRQADGSVVWVDQKTGDVYVPNLLANLAGEPDITF